MRYGRSWAAISTSTRWSDEWREALALPEPSGPLVWLHGDLRPGNLLVHDGRMHAVIDFGALSVGAPDAEHATVWDLPDRARRAYWDELDLDDATWTRARAGDRGGGGRRPYYWHTYPEFVAECRARLRDPASDSRPQPGADRALEVRPIELRCARPTG